jgi:hypothetical protein
MTKRKPEEAAKSSPHQIGNERTRGGKDAKSGNPNLGDLAETLKFRSAK